MLLFPQRQKICKKNKQNGPLCLNPTACIIVLSKIKIVEDIWILHDIFPSIKDLVPSQSLFPFNSVHSFSITIRTGNLKATKQLHSLGRHWWSCGYHTHHWIQGSRVQTQLGSIDLSERKNPEYDFVQKGSKTMVSHVDLRHIKQPQAEIRASEQNLSLTVESEANDLRC